MSNAFTAAAAVLHADANLSEAAIYYAGGIGPGVALRVIRTAPDATEQAFSIGIVRETDVLSVAVAILPSVAIGDVFTLAGGVQLTVVSHPMRDVTQTAWQVMCRR
jgi:hypothetical protein